MWFEHALLELIRSKKLSSNYLLFFYRDVIVLGMGLSRESTGKSRPLVIRKDCIWLHMEIS